jgi:hypothetical protein
MTMRQPKSTEKLCILVEIDLKAPITKQMGRDLPKRLEQAGYDFIMARGGECGEVKARQVDEPKKV